MIAVLVASFVFPGGDDATLARAVASLGGRNVVVLADPQRRTAAYRHDFDSEIGVQNVLGRMYDLAWAEDGTATTGKAFPLWVIFRNQKDFAVLAASGETPRAGGGRVTFASAPGRTVAFAQIATLFPEGKLKWSWFFDDERFALSVRSVTPRALLDLTAKAGGGRIVEKDGTLNIEIDPTALRRRAREEFARIRPDGFYDEVDLAFMDAVYADLSDAEILAAYATRETQVPVALRTARLQSLAAGRAEHMLERSVRDRSQTPGAVGSSSWIRNTFDFKSGFTAILNPNGPPLLRVRSYDGTSAYNF